MAVYTYGATNINFSTFDVWSNANFTDDTDITLSTVLTDAYPASTNPLGVSEIYNRSWFYGNVIAGSNGNVAVTGPYSSGTSTGTIVVKNVDYSVYSYVRLVATPTYPFTFSSWRTAASGGGSVISTNATLDLYVGDQTATVNFYAYFV